MRRFAIAVTLCALWIAAPALAHDPAIEEEDWGDFDAPVELADATISYALYGYLDEGDVDVFRLDFPEADELLRAEVLVPVCGEHYVDFYPHYAVFTEVENAADPALADVEFPFSIPTGLHPVMASGGHDHVGEGTDHNGEATETRPSYVEPIGGTAFYEAPRLNWDVPAAGTYYVAVYADDGHMGDYTLATGYREVFNSPRIEMLQAVAAIRSGAWLHRDCALAPDDPNAVVEHEHYD